jgi:hypothetical protein
MCRASDMGAEARDGLGPMGRATSGLARGASRTAAGMGGLPLLRDAFPRSCTRWVSRGGLPAALFPCG